MSKWLQCKVYCLSAFSTVQDGAVPASARFHSNKAIRACRQPLHASTSRCLQMNELHTELGLSRTDHSNGM